MGLVCWARVLSTSDNVAPLRVLTAKITTQTTPSQDVTAPTEITSGNATVLSRNFTIIFPLSWFISSVLLFFSDFGYELDESSSQCKQQNWASADVLKRIHCVDNANFDQSNGFVIFADSISDGFASSLISFPVIAKCRPTFVATTLRCFQCESPAITSTHRLTFT